MRKLKIINAVLVLALLVSMTGVIHTMRKYNNVVYTYESLINLKEYTIRQLQEKNEVLKEGNDIMYERIEEKDVFVYNLSREEVNILAKCVEAEAGVNNLESQRYVTQVILNRVYSKEFPNTVKEVIYQKSGKIPQFSVAYDGSMNREVDPKTLANVYSVLMHGTDLPEYVLFFYSSSVKGNWVNTLKKYKTVEGTVFAYSKR